MKVLIIGSGGREHAIAWKLKFQNPDIEIFAAPGNPGITLLGGKCYPGIKANDIDLIVAYAKSLRPDLVVVGPEVPLALGLVDLLTLEGIKTFGPTQVAAKLESSKLFAKRIMNAAHVPTAAYVDFSDYDTAIDYLDNEFERDQFVVKADGLAAGKGAFVCHTKDEAKEAINDLLRVHTLGDAGKVIIVEEFLPGPECSVFAVCDGTNFIYMPPIRDFKRRFNNDEGPNTGGMGAIYPIPEQSAELMEVIKTTIIAPTLDEMRRRGTPYRGLLYFGLKLTPVCPKVVEFNVRFGDPEGQVAMPMLEENLFDLMMQSITGITETRPAKWAKGACVCVVAVTEDYPNSGSKGEIITGLEEIAEDGTLDFHAGTAFSGDDIVTNGGRILDFTGWGIDLPTALSAIYKRAEQAHFDGIDFRTDIGKIVAT